MKRTGMLVTVLVLIVVMSTLLGSYRQGSAFEHFGANKTSCDGKLSTNNFVNFIPGTFKDNCAACSLKPNRAMNGLILQCTCKDPTDSSKCINNVKGAVTIDPIDMYYDRLSYQYMLGQDGIAVNPMQLETNNFAPPVLSL